MGSRNPGQLAVFHDFQPGAWGGGNQFMKALCAEIERQGHEVICNDITQRTQACLFNSFNFDFDRLRRLRRSGVRMVHRIDGPIAVYRGFDDGTDRRIADLNADMADATILQSSYSLHKHTELGFAYKAPCLIMNAVNPEIFHASERARNLTGPRIRLVAVSWSDNLNKGAETYKWMEDHLDWDRFDFTFVGRTKIRFRKIRMVEPLPSVRLADELRRHDIFVTASRNDPCSNSLLEALACGLPALYLNSGGHPEIAGEAGFRFEAPEEIPDLLERLVKEYADRQARIRLPTLAEVAGRYLAVMGLGGGGEGACFVQG